jgi:hypothetical protein
MKDEGILLSEAQVNEQIFLSKDHHLAKNTSFSTATTERMSFKT